VVIFLLNATEVLKREVDNFLEEDWRIKVQNERDVVLESYDKYQLLKIKLEDNISINENVPGVWIRMTELGSNSTGQDDLIYYFQIDNCNYEFVVTIREKGPNLELNFYLEQKGKKHKQELIEVFSWFKKTIFTLPNIRLISITETVNTSHNGYLTDILRESNL
jgi:hypothetical protein